MFKKSYVALKEELLKEKDYVHNSNFVVRTFVSHLRNASA